MAVGTFNPDPPFPILDQGNVGEWWQLPYLMNWDVREPGRALWDVRNESVVRTVELLGEGFVYADSRLYGPANGPVVSGTVTSYSESRDGVPLWTFTGLSLTAAEIQQYGRGPDPSRPANEYNGLEIYALRGADTITGTNGDNSISGHGGDDELRGLAGADRIRGGEGADRLFGDAGNDELDGGPGDDRLEGSVGQDTAATAALQRQVDVVLSGGAGTMVGPEGADTLSGVEALRFIDGVLHLDPAGAAGQVWRLYGAAFGRDAETTGLSAWVGALDAGATTLAAVAGALLGSAEFAQRHGRLGDAEFVERLYADVLGRDPDDAGLQAWTAQLAKGVSRAEVLLGFSESQENRAATDRAIAGGLWTVDAEALEVVRCYMAALGRPPDAEGLAQWTSLRDNGRLGAAEMVDAFVASAEFRTRFGSLSNEDFVADLYQAALGRPADGPGQASWTAGLDSGAIGRGDVVRGFAYSDEMTQKLLPLVGDGIAFA